MQSVSSRIWTCVTVSISYDNNHYTTGRGIWMFIPFPKVLENVIVWIEFKLTMMSQSSTLTTTLRELPSILYIVTNTTNMNSFYFFSSNLRELQNYKKERAIWVIPTWMVHQETRTCFRDSTKEWVIEARHKIDGSLKEEVSPFCHVLLNFVRVCSAFLFLAPSFFFTL